MDISPVVIFSGIIILSTLATLAYVMTLKPVDKGGKL